MRLLNVLTLFILFFFVAVQLLPQTSAFTTGYDGGKSYVYKDVDGNLVGKRFDFRGTIYGTDNLTTDPIDITSFIESVVLDSTRRILWNNFETYLSGGAADSSRKLTVQVLTSSSKNGTYQTTQTLMTADSVATVLNDQVNIGTKLQPWLKFKFIGATGNDTTTFGSNWNAWRFP